MEQYILTIRNRNEYRVLHTEYFKNMEKAERKLEKLQKKLQYFQVLELAKEERDGNENWLGGKLLKRIAK